jgi:hypothetical protein
MNIFIVPLFILFPVLSIPLMVYFSVKQRFRENVPLLSISLALGLLAYAYVPDDSKDIYRHYLLVRDFDIYGVDYFLYSLQFIGGPALFYLIAYISGVSDVYNLMPLFMVTFTYGLCLLGIKNTFIKYNINEKIVVFVAVLWVFSSLSYPFISTNLRQPLAVALVFYFIQVRKANKILISVALILASLLHFTGALMAACVLISYLWMNKTYLNLIFSSLFLFAGILLIYFLNFDFLNFIGYNFGVEEKVYLYNDAKDSNDYQIQTFWKYLLLSYFNACTFIILCSQVFFRKSWGLIIDSLEARFVIVFFGVTLFFINNPIVFQRLMFYVPLFGLPILTVYLVKHSKASFWYWVTMVSLFVSIVYAIFLQWANLGGFNYWPGVFYRDVFSILIFGRNYFLSF